MYKFRWIFKALHGRCVLLGYSGIKSLNAMTRGSIVMLTLFCFVVYTLVSMNE